MSQEFEYKVKDTKFRCRNLNQRQDPLSNKGMIADNRNHYKVTRMIVSKRRNLLRESCDIRIQARICDQSPGMQRAEMNIYCKLSIVNLSIYIFIEYECILTVFVTQSPQGANNLFHISPLWTQLQHYIESCCEGEHILLGHTLITVLL